MTVTLPADIEAWLASRVATGEFASIDEAAGRMLAERMAEDVDDLSWTGPYVEEGLAALARGEVISVEDHLAEMRAHLAKITV